MAHLLLEHLAEDFAAHVLGAGLVVRHHPARRRQDRDSEAALERLQVLDLRIHAPARLRYTRDVPDDRLALVILQLRSEEHTSALQSLMRISYAVFCLKKKTEMQSRLPTPT